MKKITDPNPDIQKLTDKLWTLFVKHGRGDTVFYRDVMTLLEIDRTHKWWTLVTNKVRMRTLRERDIATRCDLGIGFRLLTNEQQVIECSQDRQKRMFRQAARCRREISRSDEQQLGLHAAKLRILVMDGLKKQSRSLRTSMKFIMNPTETLPRRTNGDSTGD